jgi:hypothetical protein
MYVPPLKVHIGWFDNPGVDPRCASIARSLYEYLHRPIADDPVLRPGLEIPVEIGRELGGLLDALEAGDAIEPPAGVRLVIAILDSAAFFRADHRSVVKRMVARWGIGPTQARNELLLPIVLHGAWNADLVVGAVRMLAALVPMSGDRDPGWLSLCADAGVVVGRALLRRLQEKDPPRPHVFISHAKSDGAAIATELMTHFNTDSRIAAWYDATDVHRGEELGRQLDAAISDGVVLVIRTDRYAESPWCALELLAAKQSRVPIVTLLATSDGELAAPAYGGNHRTMNWAPGRKREVTARCVQAWLHGHHFRAHAAAALARAGLPADSDILSRKPELIDVMTSGGGPGAHLLVHPDPPPPQFEADLLRLARPSVRLATPNTLLGRVLLAQDPLPPLSRTQIAFSLSIAPGLPSVETPVIGPGLTQDHIDDVLHAIVVATLQSGATIAYGGDFRVHRGYARKLADFHRSHRRLATGAGAQLVCFLDERGRRGISDGDVEFWPVTVAAPAGAAAFPDLASTLWHLAMRDEMARTCHARILLGGKLDPAATAGDDGYTGAWPSLLEEGARTLHAGKALYVLGGFGGAAGAIAEMLRSGQVPPVFTRAHTAPALAELTSELDAARAAMLSAGGDLAVLLASDGGALLGIDELASTLLDRWRRFCDGDKDAWMNGLSREENERLFRATDRTEVTHLVFEGLRRVTRTPEGALSIAIYHGDIASVPNVQGYAVTMTPGVPPIGASQALGRLGAQLPTVTAGSERRVTRTDLAGHEVLTARLDAPPAGEPLAPGAVETLAAEVAREADTRGIESIACAPFGTTMGITTRDSVLAMIAGIATSRGSQPSRLVICERDPARYDELKAALAERHPTFVELRAGVIEARATDGIVLLIDAIEPTASSPGQLRTTLFATEDRRPVAPRHDAEISLREWQDLRGRLTSFADSTDRGRALWSRLFSTEIQRRLSRNRDVRLAVLTTEIAAGLPWELLTGEDGRPHALERGFVRRIALQGKVREPASHGRGNALLRVLLVVNPTRDLPEATPEGDAVQAALKGRADVQITRIDGAAATRLAVIDALATGSYDVLHFAGHAYYDTTKRSRSGIYLHDGVLTAGDLPAATPPRFVFLSACESARVRDMVPLPAQLPPPLHPRATRPPEDGAPLAEEFLRAGVSALIGTFVPVIDGAAHDFATAVHAKLAAGEPLGVAMRHARTLLHDARQRDWGNFLLYGDDELVL